MKLKSLRIVMSVFTFAMAVSLSGCVLTEVADRGDKVEDTEEEPEEKPEKESKKEKKKDKDKDKEKDTDKEKEPKEEKNDDESEKLRVYLGTKNDILEFLNGDWYLMDTETGEDYAKLSFGTDGSCSFERLYDKQSCNGNITFSSTYTDEAYGADTCTVTFKDIPSDYKIKADFDVYLPTEDSFDALFTVGRAAGEDCMSLEFLGNDITFVSQFMFSNYFYDDGVEHGSDTGCFLHRENDIKSVKGRDDSDKTFYGFLWDRSEGDRLGIQKMIVSSQEDYDEYTNRKFESASFVEDDNIGIVEYECTASVNTDSIFANDVFEAKKPLRVYEFATDSDGKIKEIKELERSYYGLYELRDLEPELSFNGMTVNYNGAVYDLSEAEVAGNAIMSCEVVGNRFVVEDHVNPHVGVYHVYNMDVGDWETDLVGAGLTWLNDDITTVVYSAYNEIYNYKGDVIGYLDGDEICELKLSADGTSVQAECFDGTKGEFELPGDMDTPMYRYYDYINRPNASTWNEFIKYAPDNACLFMIMNPPEFILDCFLDKEVIDKSSSDNVIAVGIKDNTTVRAETGTYSSDNKWKTKKKGTDFKLRKGQNKTFTVKISEGIPDRCMYVKTDTDEMYYPIRLITGQFDVNCVFVY
ncbi:MAG: hypothetical protein K6G69_07670 [Lachnospiraceae bacterium]|nr:hypothetical protein [Lachnospiraceae bacterium]